MPSTAEVKPEYSPRPPEQIISPGDFRIVSASIPGVQRDELQATVSGIKLPEDVALTIGFGQLVELHYKEQAPDSDLTEGAFRQLLEAFPNQDSLIGIEWIPSQSNRAIGGLAGAWDRACLHRAISIHARLYRGISANEFVSSVLGKFWMKSRDLHPKARQRIATTFNWRLAEKKGQGHRGALVPSIIIALSVDNPEPAVA